MGHEVIVVSAGDNFKKFPADILVSYSTLPGILGIIARYCYFFRLFNKLKKQKFDVVQLVNHFTFAETNSSFFSFKNFLIKQKKISLLSCGDDVINRYDENFKLYFDNVFHFDGFNQKIYENGKTINYAKELISSGHSINIACNNTYYDSCVKYIDNFKNKDNLEMRFFPQPIFMPFNLANIEDIPNCKQEKIIFWHGLNRVGAKGTNYIEKAFKIINDKYPDIVECKIEGKMPYDEFKNFLKSVNVYVDQVFFEDGYGYSTISALAGNKIVMGADGNQIEKSLGLDYKIPLVGLKPDVEYIVKRMELIINNIDYYIELSKNARKFINHFHNPERIANQYIKAWESFQSIQDLKG